MENVTTYAIIKTGGKQYRVAPGQKIRVEKIEKADGDQVSFDVLFVKDGDKVQTGKPTVAGAAVTGQIVRQAKTKKVLVFKKRAKKGYKKLQGHRQNVTEVLIKSVQAAA
jgi:large subunit ribosomal protein L21